MRLPIKVTVTDVCPRDGFQMESNFIPTQAKISIVEAIAEAGVPRIEATSFVSPTAVPQMRDAADVMKGIRRKSGTTYAALVPNMHGARLAVENGIDCLRVVLAATETSNKQNIRMSIEESLSQCELIYQLASDNHVASEAIVAVAFGCPFEGDVGAGVLSKILQRLATIGFKHVSLADTVGISNPLAVYRRCSWIGEHFPQFSLGIHLHNTRGLALSNVLAALQAGVENIDSSTGGLGGCPFVRGGSGNVPTEDLVNMLTEMEIENRIDIESVFKASSLVASTLGKTLPSYTLKAGTRRTLYKLADKRCAQQL